MDESSRPVKFSFINIGGTSGAERQKIINDLKKINCYYYDLNAIEHVQNGLSEPAPDVHLTNGQKSRGPWKLNANAPVFEPKANGRLDLKTRADPPLKGIQLLAGGPQGRDPSETTSPQPPQNAWASPQQGSSLFKNHDQNKKCTSQRPVKGDGNFSPKGSVHTPPCESEEKIDRPSPGAEQEARSIISAVADLVKSPMDGSRKVKLPQPCGIKNDGTSCYVICVLQAMIAVHEFVNILSSLKQAVGQFSLDLVENQAPVVTSLMRQYQDYQERKMVNGEGIELHLTKHLDAFNNPDVQVGKQGDPAEFFAELISKIQDEFRTIKKERVSMLANPDDWQTLMTLSNNYHIFEQAGSDQGDEDEGGWQQVKVGRRAGRRQMFQNRNCPLNHIYGGSNVYYTFTGVGELSQVSSVSKADAFISSIIPVEHPSILTVEDAVNKYHSRETSENRLSRQTFLYQLPRILFLTFVNTTMEDGSPKKITKQIRLQEVLKVSPDWCVPELRTEIMTNDYRYRLVSGFFHFGGSYESGHYIAFQTRPPTPSGPRWVILDDHFVRYVHPKEVLDYQTGGYFANTTAVPHGLMFRLERNGKKACHPPCVPPQV